MIAMDLTNHIICLLYTSHLKWSLESDAKSLLMNLDITDFEQKTSELSGGQRKRVALVAAVLKPCDVLILDEPTNHLDYEMVEWLEDFLRKFRGAIIMVTHDRYFLDSVCNRIVEIDKGSAYSYDTNYSGFLERKAAREESERASERKRQSILCLLYTSHIISMELLQMRMTLDVSCRRSVLNVL